MDANCASACAFRSHSDTACDGEQGIGPSFRLSGKFVLLASVTRHGGLGEYFFGSPLGSTASRGSSPTGSLLIWGSLCFEPRGEATAVPFCPRATPWLAAALETKERWLSPSSGLFRICVMRRTWFALCAEFNLRQAQKIYRWQKKSRRAGGILISLIELDRGRPSMDPCYQASYGSVVEVGEG